MRSSSTFVGGVLFVVSCILALAGCAHGGGGKESEIRPQAEGVTRLKVEGPVLLRLKAQMGRSETVAYFHRSTSRSYEATELRHQKDESIEFTSQAQTLNVEPESGRFTQVITVTHKDGAANLHDFAMPEVGERLEVTADSLGRILKSGEYPSNSIFFVPPISLPEEPVQVGDTWTMQATWLSLGEMVPYQLDMVSILKGFASCGKDRCADIEISGEVSFQGALKQVLMFKSQWKGRLLFALDAGTVVWSRTESDEQLVAENVRRDVSGCLESVLLEPAEIQLAGLTKPKCEPVMAQVTSN